MKKALPFMAGAAMASPECCGGGGGGESAGEVDTIVNKQGEVAEEAETHEFQAEVWQKSINFKNNSSKSNLFNLLTVYVSTNVSNFVSTFFQFFIFVNLG